MDVTTRDRVRYWLRVAIRMTLALAFLSYAVAKLVGTQFISDGPTLERPVGELSGFEFTWAYFGYSKLFAWFVAGGQLGAAALLLFDRTARLGAAVLLPITANIVIVNFAFNISADTKVASVVYLALNLALVADDWRAWKRVLWDEPANDPARPRALSHPAVPVVKLALFAAAGTAIWWGLEAAQQAVAPRTPLAGDWEVVSVALGGRPVAPDPAKPQWRRVYFEGEAFAIATDRGLISGRHAATPDGAVEIGYSPEPPPPLTAAEFAAAVSNLPNLTADEIGRQMEEDRNRAFPLTIRGTYRREGTTLGSSGRQNGEPVELVLRPLVRPKF